MANPVSIQRWSSYLDVDEVSDWLQFPAPPTGTQRNLLNRVIDMACTWAQNYCNRPIAPTRYTERHDGWSGEYIMLEHAPFLELIKCTEWQSSGGPLELLESTPENPIDGIQVDYGTGRIMRTFAGYSWPRPFFPGSRNIEITYMAGFNPLPPDIWMGTVELVAHWWRNTQQASRGPTRAGEYDPSAESSDNGLWQGVPYRLIALFDPYRIPSIA